jgi:sugar lactone lactonase YvrE
MGTQSSTSPEQEPVRGSRSTTDLIVRSCQAVCLTIAVAVRVIAQAPAGTLPLVLPSAIAFDTQGNLYIADAGEHVIRKLSASGAITTVAGTGVQGFSGDNGPASAAQLDSPAGLAVDASGNLYIADSHNHRVRKVAAATSLISTFAGSGMAGFSGDGGSATGAALDLPTALALDSSGNLYIADTNNHRIRKISASTGVIVTVAGNGTQGFTGDGGLARSAAIDSPGGLAVDAAGNLYLADTHNGRVRELSATTGLISTVAGGSARPFAGDGGLATSAGLNMPRGLTLDSAGNLYVADSANHRIRRISPSGKITTAVGEGTEAFAGDGTPAVTATLDSPLSVAISPGDLLTLSDTGNKRVRQLDSLAAPGPDIHTIIGLGYSAPGTLSLTGPSVAAYGSGTVTATISAPASGSVTFLDANGSAPITLGLVTLDPAGSATLSLGSLPAGSHTLTAIYPGDSTHSAAQSQTLAITITPHAVVATASPISILYGQTVPVLAGTLTGVLPQDSGGVSALFATTATALSPAGLYPIAATLTGSAAANYTLTVTPTDLSIVRAPTLATLSGTPSNSTLGLPVTLNVQIAPTTSGTPTGNIKLLDGATTVATLQLSGGGAAFTTNAFTLGGHSLAAVYSGDANFLPSTSPIASIVVAGGSDFSFTPTGAPAQAVPAGSSATFNFSVGVQGSALASPITLAAQGAPPGATVSFAPATIPPGGTVTSFTMTIQTPRAALEKPPNPQPAYPISPLLAGILLPAIAVGKGLRCRGRAAGRIVVWALAFAVSTALITGCGNRVNTAAELTTVATYTITVTGTATSPSGLALQHTATVTLQVL